MFNRTDAVFLWMKKNIYNLMEADYQLESAYLIQYLKKVGVSCTQFIQENLTDISDLADELLSYNSEFILLYVDKNNFYVSRYISYEIKRVEKVEVIWILDESIKNMHLEKEGADDYLRLYEVDKLLKIIGAEIPEEASLKNICIYNNNFIPVIKAEDIGICVEKKFQGHDEIVNFPEYIIKDLDYINNSGNKNISESVIELKTENICDYEKLDELCSSIRRSNYGFKFKTTCRADEKLKEKFPLLIKSFFHEFNVNLYDMEHFNEIKSIYSNSDDSIKFNLLINFNNTEELNEIVRAEYPDNVKLNFSNLKCTRISSDLAEKINILGNSGNRNIAFKNGFICFNTGLYLNSAGYKDIALERNVRHVEIDGMLVDKKDCSTMEDLVSINSAVIVRGEGRKPIGSIYMDGFNEVKCKLETYETNRRIMEEEGLYIGHIYELDEQEEGRYDFRVDNQYEKMKIIKTKYSHALEEAPGLQILSIEDREDLEAYVKNIEYFRKNGYIKNKYEVDSYLSNTCRWHGNKRCSIYMMPRMTIRNGEVYPCSGCSRSLGRLEEGYLKLNQKIYLLADKFQAGRGCSSCDEKAICSKCFMLPEFMTDTEFCSMIRSKPYIKKYIEYIELIRVLKENTKTFQNISAGDVKISSNYKTHIIPENIISGDKTYVYPYIFLLYLRGKPLICNAGTQKLLKINSKMAAILEILYKGLDRKHTVDLISQYFKIDHDCSNKLLKSANSMLSNYGVIKRLGVI